MKRIIIVMLLTTMWLNAFAQNFTIKGHLTDVKNDTIHIEYVKREPEREIITASIPIDSNGCFSYDCKIQYVYNASLTVQSNNNKSYFFFVPDERVDVNGLSNFAAGWTIKGSAFYQELDRVRLIMLPFFMEFKEAGDKFDKGIIDGLDRVKLDNERKATIREINNRMYKVTYQYLKQYPNEEASATILFQLDYKDILPAIQLLSSDVRNGRFKDYIDNLESLFGRVKKEEKAVKSAKAELEENKQSPDFTLKDINGDDFHLSSLFNKNKYVVVDFWGSWCSWCIEGFSRMAEYYSKYKDKLDIVGVACYDKENKWKAAVSRNNIPWYHVFSADGTTEVRFGVTGYPYKVLISPEGKVIKYFRGETEEFYQLLDERLE